MISEEELKCEDDVWSFDSIKKFSLASLNRVNRKMRNWFYSCKEIFIKSGYCKFLLNQGYMLFVIGMNFYVPVFHLFPDFAT